MTAAKEIIGEADGEMIPIFRMASNADVSDPLFEEEIVFALSKNNLADEIDAYFSDVAAATATDEGSRYLRMRRLLKIRYTGVKMRRILSSGRCGLCKQGMTKIM